MTRNNTETGTHRKGQEKTSKPPVTSKTSGSARLSVLFLTAALLLLTACGAEGTGSSGENKGAENSGENVPSESADASGSEPADPAQVPGMEAIPEDDTALLQLEEGEAILFPTPEAGQSVSESSIPEMDLSFDDPGCAGWITVPAAGITAEIFEYTAAADAASTSDTTAGASDAETADPAQSTSGSAPAVLYLSEYCALTLDDGNTVLSGAADQEGFQYAGELFNPDVYTNGIYMYVYTPQQTTEFRLFAAYEQESGGRTGGAGLPDL